MTIFEYFSKRSAEESDDGLNGLGICADFCDDVFDTSITIDIFDPNENDNYDMFCLELCKKVELVVDEESFAGEFPVCVAKWTSFIEENIDKFRRFSDEYWVKNNWEDNDDFIMEWIQQLQLYASGYGTDSEYELLLDLVSSC